MSDIQYKGTNSERFTVADGDYTPYLPMGTIEMVDRKYKEWLIRRGFASEESLNSFALKGAAKAAAANKKNKKKVAKNDHVNSVEM
jgi:hypothetical protein